MTSTSAEQDFLIKTMESRLKRALYHMETYKCADETENVEQAALQTALYKAQYLRETIEIVLKDMHELKTITVNKGE